MRKSGSEGESENNQATNRGEARAGVEIDEVKEFWVEIVDRGLGRIRFVTIGIVAPGGVGLNLGQIGLLELDDMVHAFELANDRIGALVEVVVEGRLDHDTNGSIESDKNRELEQDSQHRAERLDIIAFIELHHLERFELTIAVAVFLNLGELGLDFANHAGLMELALHQRPKADFYQDGEKDNREAKITNETVNDKKDIRNRANNQKINQLKHESIIA